MMAGETFSFEEASKPGAPQKIASGTTFSFEDAQVAPRPERSMTEEAGRQVALTGRAAVKGAADLAGVVADAVTGPINAGLDLALGEGKGFRFQKLGAAAENLMNAAGVAKPESSTERVVQDVVGAGTQAAGTVGLGNVIAKAAGPLSRAVGQALSAGPGLQVASAASGTAASSAVREEGGGAGAQIAAGLAGGLAPGFAGPALKEGFRRALRGGEEGRQRVAANVAAFEEAGTTPTLGQATDGRIARATESLLAKAPGGAGVIAKKAQQQADDMAATVQRMSDALAPDASAINAGEAIGRGVQTFKQAFKEQQKALYDALDTFIPASTRIKADRTQQALESLNEDIAGSPALSKWFKNARIQGIESGLKSDKEGIEAVLTRPGMAEHVAQMRANLQLAARRAAESNVERRSLGMSNLEEVLTPEQIEDRIQGFLHTQVDDRLGYQALKKLRTLVGRELEEGGLAADVPRSKWRALYGAISEDLGAAAQEAGPRATQVWDRANHYTRLGLERLEQLDKVLSRDAPEKVFTAAISGTTEGNTTVRRVMKSLPMNERKSVAAAVLQRLGRAAPGQQNADADAFSSETFLTNLAKMHPAARRDVFGYVKDSELLERVQKIAKAAESRRQGGRIFANPSGTASSVAQLANAGSMGAALMTGSPGATALAFGAPAAANVAARLVTNPALVKGVAGKTVLAPGATATAVEQAARAGQTLDQRGATPMEVADQDQQESVNVSGVDSPELVAQGTDGGSGGDASASGGSTLAAGVHDGRLGDPAAAPGASGPEDVPVRDGAGERAAGVADPADSFGVEQKAGGQILLTGDPKAIKETLISIGFPERVLQVTPKGVMVKKAGIGKLQELMGAAEGQ